MSAIHPVFPSSSAVLGSTVSGSLAGLEPGSSRSPNHAEQAQIQSLLDGVAHLLHPSIERCGIYLVCGVAFGTKLYR